MPRARLAFLFACLAATAAAPAWAQTAAPAADATPTAAPAPAVAAVVERDGVGVINLGRPLNVRWYAQAEMAMPGLGGIRLGAEAYLPGLPLFAGLQFARDFGVDPLHNAGQEDTLLTRFLTGTRTWDIRAGFLWRDWTRKTESMHYDHDYGSHLGNTTFKRATYELDAPAWRALTFYGGLRYREVPGAQACMAGPKGVTENCVTTEAAFLMVGIQRTLSYDLDVNTKEHGALTWSNTKSIDVHLLYATNADLWGRGELRKRIGAEVVVLQAKPDLGLAVHYGFGWDGQYLLLQGGLGVGGTRTFVGEVKSAREIPLSDP